MFGMIWLGVAITTLNLVAAAGNAYHVIAGTALWWPLTTFMAGACLAAAVYSGRATLRFWRARPGPPVSDGKGV